MKSSGVIQDHLESFMSWGEKITYKVRTFWKAHIIWKNLPYGFDVYKVNQLICQNHKADFFKFCVFLRKSKLYYKNAMLLKKRQTQCPNCNMIKVSSKIMWGHEPTIPISSAWPEILNPPYCRRLFAPWMQFCLLTALKIHKNGRKGNFPNAH